MNLNSSITRIPKIGPKYSKLLEKLNISTVENLLTHYPFRYEDLSKIKKISETTIDETVTIEATLLDIKNIFTKNNKRLTKATISDNSGMMDVIWFNQHFLIKSLKKGRRYTFTGKVGTFSKKKALIAPVQELVKDESLNTGRIVPVYNETAGINSKWLRSRIHFVLDSFKDSEILDDPIPQEIIEKEGYLDYEEALNKIHFPEKMSEVEKAKERLGFDELFYELLRVEGSKKEWHEQFEGIKLNFNQFEKELNEIVKSLPFSLTQSQQKVIDEIKNDMKKSHPMNRLLEGDVGSGKTIVAIIISYICHLNGYKTLYMAPTEILAKQHHESYLKFLKDFNVDIKLQTGSNKSEFTENKNDIVIGTHALLFSKEPIQNVGLVVVDEQHRFGVKQRTKLLELGVDNKKPNLLTMTATPIPRTLALTLYGDLDLSILDAVPNSDKKITTKVIPENYRKKAFKWIKDRGEQAFIVCPFIEESEHEAFENVRAATAEYEKLKTGIFADLKVGLLHGRMKPEEKAEIMQDFRNKKYQVLVSTPVIEVGVDIPEATIIVIESAERYGLASLHQLRGRVGRGSKEGFCFLFMSNFSKKSYARLKNLEEIDSGLKLAEIDMEFRGQGDIYGTMQSGIKKFKLANLNDIETITKAKKYAEKYYSELEKLPKLKNATYRSNIDLVQNN